MTEKVVENFKKDFSLIKQKGFVESHRSHNTGIGKTFEDLIGVAENNRQHVDYMDEIEIKSSRDLSNSMVTLFTKSPSYPKDANTRLREQFGKDEEGLKILHTTIPGNKFNTFLGKFGFKLEVNETDKRIYIIVKDLETDRIIDSSCYYSFEDLQQIIEEKCKNIAFITASNKTVNNKELFHFEKATLLTGLTFRKFLDAVKNGNILYDIRIGAYRSGANEGKSHDHGSGFRIKKEQISQIFTVDEI